MRPDWAEVLAEHADATLPIIAHLANERRSRRVCSCGATFTGAHRAHLAAVLDAELDDWLGADETRERMARALDWHLPDGYGDHGCALRCGWSDEGTTDSAGEHLTAAALATLTDRSTRMAAEAGEKRGAERALREAADDWEARCTRDHPLDAEVADRLIPWLRDRADRIGGE